MLAEARRLTCRLDRYVIRGRGRLEGETRPVAVVTTNLVACGGGNSGEALFDVFVRGRDGRARRLVKPPAGQLPRFALDARLRDGRIAVLGLDYVEGDPRCCPSVERTVTVVAHAGGLRVVPPPDP